MKHLIWVIKLISMKKQADVGAKRYLECQVSS